MNYGFPYMFFIYFFSGFNCLVAVELRFYLHFGGAQQRLHLFKVDLLEEEPFVFKKKKEEWSFNATVNGCEGVLYTASPIIFWP